MKSVIFVGLLILFRIKQNKIPLSYLNQYPNLRTFILAFFLLCFNAFLRQFGLLSKKNLKGQHAFITGGAMGIGKQMAIRLARLGCKITIADMNKEVGEKTVAELKKITQNVIFQELDVTDSARLKVVAEECEKVNGQVDILINNAGIVTGKKILDANEKAIQKVYDVNAVSHAYTVRQFLPSMLQRDNGHIVTIASVAGHFGVAGLADYCGSKFAAVGFDESVRQELLKKKSNVKTTCICPFYINTGMFDGVKINLLLRLFTPLLEEKYVGWRIVTAIQQDEKLVFLPWFLNVLKIVQALIPIEVCDFLMGALGVNSSMDEFKGRFGQSK